RTASARRALLERLRGQEDQLARDVLELRIELRRGRDHDDVDPARELGIGEPERLAEDPPHAVAPHRGLPDRLPDREAEPRVLETVLPDDDVHAGSARPPAFAEHRAEVALADEAHPAQEGERSRHRASLVLSMRADAPSI